MRVPCSLAVWRMRRLHLRLQVHRGLAESPFLFRPLLEDEQPRLGLFSSLFSCRHSVNRFAIASICALVQAPPEPTEARVFWTSLPDSRALVRAVTYQKIGLWSNPVSGSINAGRWHLCANQAFPR